VSISHAYVYQPRIHTYFEDSQSFIIDPVLKEKKGKERKGKGREGKGREECNNKFVKLDEKSSSSFFCFVLFFKRGFLCVALAVLKLIL
jgi:hypothetical protein